MFNFNPASITVLSDETRAAIAAADDALLSNAQMLSTVIQTAKTSDLPINVTQDLYGSFIEGANRFLEGRECLRKSVRTMHAIAARSPHAERMEGCPLGFPDLTGALDRRPMAKAAVEPVRVD